jgi:chitin disaccharide deacetylase
MPALDAYAESSTPPERIFLTFDDGPIDASLNVLTVLKNNHIKATFFVNGFQLTGEAPHERRKHSGLAFRRMIKEGHVVGNHSFDHMNHNAIAGGRASSTDSYRNVLVDSQSFIPKNADVVNRALGSLKNSPNNAILSLGRMPFSNNWVLPGMTVICACCTNDGIPPWDADSKCGSKELPISNSARLGGEVAKKLFRENGMLIFGWDVEWQPSNWEINNFSDTLVPAEILEQDIMDVFAGKKCTIKMLSPEVSCGSKTVTGKVIVLTHDSLYENSWRGRGKDVNLPQLDKLIKSLKAKGYLFDTLDHYLH